MPRTPDPQPALTHIGAVTEAGTVADLAAAAATPTALEPGKLYSVVVPHGYQHIAVSTDHLLDRPARKQGTVTLHTAASLSDYVKAHREPGAALYADQETATVTAVLNGHTTDQPGWGDHRAVLRLRTTPEWTAWADNADRYLDQVTFAEHLQAHADTIMQPSAAAVLELVLRFQATLTVEFTSVRNLADGTVQMVYAETERNGRGELTAPRQFTIALPPFDGARLVELTAHLRHRIDDHRKLRIGYWLPHRQQALAEAFDDEVAHIETAVDLTAYRGRPA